jgi:hypothetical protein
VVQNCTNGEQHLFKGEQNLGRRGATVAAEQVSLRDK